MLRVFVFGCVVSPTIALLIPDGSKLRRAARVAPRLSDSGAESGCWEEDVLGREPFELTRAMCEKSIPNVGDVSKLQRVVQMLAERRCVTMVAIGGSVTCGHQAGGKKNAYPQKLQDWLNLKFPCSGAHGRPQLHHVENVCHDSRGSLHWADQIASWRSDARHKLWSADLVIVETSVNDLLAWTEENASTPDIQRVGVCTELIIRQLLSSPSDPAIVYLEASFRASSDPPFHKDAAQAHLPVLQYYDVPQVSVINALTPFYSASRRHWVYQNYFGYHDKVHPGVFGHKVLTQLLIHALSSAGSKIDANRLFRGNWFLRAPDDDEKPPLLLVSQQVADQYAKASWMHLELTEAEQVGHLVKGKTLFLVNEDVPGKPGLLADQVGASVLLASAFERPARGRDMAVNLGVLKSYEGTGVAQVTLKVAPGTTCSAELAQTATVVTEATRVDCLWPETVSIKDVVHMTLKASGDLPKEGCLFVQISIVEASPPRRENKIKLLDLTLSL